MTCFGGSERGICFPWKQQRHNLDERSYVNCRAFQAAFSGIICSLIQPVKWSKTEV